MHQAYIYYHENHKRGTIERDRTDCRKPFLNSLGMASSLVPPLENEVTYDSVPYESGYRSYLALAEQAASEAGDLMVQAQEAEHSLDRAEEAYKLTVENAIETAADEVASICGESAATAVSSRNQTLKCLPEMGHLEDSVLKQWIGQFVSASHATPPRIVRRWNEDMWNCYLKRLELG